MAAGWIILIVSLNIGDVAVAIEPYVSAGDFDTKAKCDGFISFREVKNAVCWKRGERTLLHVYGVDLGDRGK